MKTNKVPWNKSMLHILLYLEKDTPKNNPVEDKFAAETMTANSQTIENDPSDQLSDNASSDCMADLPMGDETPLNLELDEYPLLEQNDNFLFPEDNSSSDTCTEILSDTIAYDVPIPQDHDEELVPIDKDGAPFSEESEVDSQVDENHLAATTPEDDESPAHFEDNQDSLSSEGKEPSLPAPDKVHSVIASKGANLLNNHSCIHVGIFNAYSYLNQGSPDTCGGIIECPAGFEKKYSRYLPC